MSDVEIDFESRLGAALAIADDKATRDDVVMAFETAAKVFGDLGVYLEALSSTDPNNTTNLRPASKRLAKWVRTLVDDLSEVTGAKVSLLASADALNVIVTSNSQLETRMVQTLWHWIEKHVERLAKVHIATLNLGRGKGKSEGTKFRNSLVVEMLAAVVTNAPVAKAEVTEPERPW